MPWIKDKKAKYKCDGCGKVIESYPKWERGEKTYSSVGCAIWDGWNPMDMFEVHPYETHESSEASPLNPVIKTAKLPKLELLMPETYA